MLCQLPGSTSLFIFSQIISLFTSHCPKKENWDTTRLTRSFFLFATLYILNDMQKRARTSHDNNQPRCNQEREENDEINMNNQVVPQEPSSMVFPSMKD